MNDNVDKDSLNNFYQTLSELVGVENMLKIYDYYKGSQLTIPIHLYDRKKTAVRIIEEFDGSNTFELAHKYKYSQKWVRKVVKNKDNYKYTADE
ncbi:Mor transcription activator family protein [Apilactobacillus micheneri]|uniref:Mor transcription activator family protein n=1 Tax=Apilactobacillus micheneri TaxID=1899430 RepID=UPI000D52152F|nr:Mor transcription activator family protein [Apilactobacillus micheneri]GAY79943.1 hypothetical protein NBRC113063_00807 [Apilactobacillus micheneri]